MNFVRALLKQVEAGLIGLFFIQALRFLIGSLYSQFQSISLAAAYPPESLPADTLGLISPDSFVIELSLLGLFVALPILMVLFGRLRYSFIVAVALAAIGRVFVNLPNDAITSVIGAEMAVSGGLLYIALLSSQRAKLFPHFFILGLALDQIIRAAGNTLDPALFDPNFASIQIGLSIAVGIIAIVNIFMQSPEETERTREGTTVNLNHGILTLWGAVGLGGALFLQLSLLSMPNAVAARADADYTIFISFVLIATMLPLIPDIRRQARRFITPFDAGTRGWIWLIIVALLIVLGVRLGNIVIANAVIPIGGVTLVLAQFAISMVWWWFVRPKTEQERNVGGLWLVLTMFVFVVLIVADIFTYEYAFVRNFAPPLDSLNTIVPPLLRGFRGLGFGVILLAAFLTTLPMIQSTKRVPWRGGSLLESAFWVMVIAGATAGTLYLSQPPLVRGVQNVENLRIATYNIHSGYSEFFNYDLEGIAQTIELSGADVVLLQEVEAGRLTSFGVDQSLWLARRLGMDRRFYPTNEGLFGLAVLSRAPIVFDDGVLLPSIDQQTGLQRVQIQPDDGAVTLYNTSLGLLLTSDGLTTQEDNQRRQLNTILSVIAAHVENDYGGQLGRAVLGGTFHNTPSSPLMQVPSQYGFIDPFAGTNLQLSATLRRSNLPLARYDYLWLWSQTLEATGTNVIVTDASDHELAVVGVQISR